ncbi:MAG: phosphoribosylamine--glycine ligase [Planctomycetota bacterium]
MSKPRRSNSRLSRPDRLKCLVVGSGGREHALVWRLHKSKSVERVYTTCHSAEMNPGIRSIAMAVDAPFAMDELYRFEQFIAKEGIHFVVVGPEVPLAEGIVDKLSESRAIAEAGHPFAVFGPTQAGAQLESSKAWAKELMRGALIPTGDARVFKEVRDAKAYLKSRDEPQVIKASGLAAGKGVVLPETLEEALETVDSMMGARVFGEAGAEVLIEEKLSGPEVSVFALCDGRNVVLLEACQDHKRAYEGDLGPNTGGMGAYCPAALLDEKTYDSVVREIVVPTVDALRREGVEYRGVLYVGLMLTPGGPKVLEYNCRFGDPECQALVRTIKGDFGDLLWKCATGGLEEAEFETSDEAAVVITLASEGYPGEYKKGLVIEGIEEAEQVEGVVVFHAGTARVDGKTVTAGGRVLSVTAVGETVAAARERAHKACEKISWPGMHWRRDIGHQAIGVGVH